MWKIIFIYLLSASFCYCQLNGKFWWTDSRVSKYNQVKIPEPVIEDISPFETDESAKIVFRDESPFQISANQKPVYYNNKFVFNASPDICHYVKEIECRGIIYSTKYGKSSKASDPQTDYDEDPYWNIKNSNFHNSQTSQKDDVAHDYVDELPKPGLIGIYSDTGIGPEWSTYNQGAASAYDAGFEYGEVDDTPSFGYSAIDPRRETKTPNLKLKPLKLQTSSEEIPYDPRNQMISYQSNPDFKVLEGFKLLYLANTKKNRFEEINDNNRSEEVFFNKPPESNFSNSEEYFSAENDEMFSDCGKSVPINKKDQQSGEATVGSHPWLALVVQTRRRNSFLCYATLIHPRAALTVANCVHNNTSPGELTLIAGMQYTNRRPRATSRISKVISHPDYSQGDLANDLAILILQVPLKLSVTIQPACLADPGNGQDCMFFGWGGFGSDIRSQSWWQRGKIRACNRRASSMQGSNIPPNTFCVSVQPRHSMVTGLGGALVCNVSGLAAVVGVIVTRQHVPVLLPVQDWAMQYTDIINEEN